MSKKQKPFQPEPYAQTICKEHTLMFVPNDSVYLYCDQGYWKAIKPDYIEAEAMELLSKDCLVRANSCSEIRKLVQLKSLIPPYLQLNEVNGYVNLQNGMLHVESRKIHPHSKDYFSTIQLPIAYNEKADKDSPVLHFRFRDEINGIVADMKPKEIRKEGLSEYFLYTIEGTETIPDKWGKRLPSFDIEDIDVESLYKYDEERWGRRAMRFVSFANDEEHNLGETPIPDGNVKIYGRADDQGSLSYVGGTNIRYIPVDEEVELNLGPARLVKVEPKLMDFETGNYIFDSNGNVAGWDEIRTWEMEITNTRALPIEIEITRGFGTPYWTIQTEMPYEKHDVTHVRVETELQPQSQHTLSYKATTYHGKRQGQVSE